MKNLITKSLTKIFVCLTIIWLIVLTILLYNLFNMFDRLNTFNTLDIPETTKITLTDHETDTSLSQEDLVEIKIEKPILADVPAISSNYFPQHPGINVYTKGTVIVDYSNSSEGYVMVNCTSENGKRIKSQVIGPGETTYTYDITINQWTAFPLSDGNGEYKVTVLEHATGNKYALLGQAKFTVNLKDEFKPFLYSNQYVNYENAPNTIAKAKEVIGKETDTLKKVELVYNYIVNNFTYDHDKAKTVKSGYLPVLDDVLSVKKGICFDYASLMAGMLRSQDTPCKLVVGYAGTAYHAWISVYSDELGWIDGVIYFDGTNWQRLDPSK